MASKELIRRVAEANDIVSVIGTYVKLTRSGAEFRALSPFSNERTPSFYVMPAKQAFYCFSSSQGGDVFRFLQLYENLTFPEALKKLADRCGIRIDEDQITPEMAAKDRHRRKLRELQGAARDWFHQLLLKDRSAQAAREYLAGRGINIAIAKRWKLGYGPEDGRAFLRWAKEHGYPPQLLVDGGLAMPSKSGQGVFFLFRHRLMFPVQNDYGETVGFSGRVLSPDQKGGKYVNSPATIIFDKSKMVFGLDRSKQAILKAGQAILCEGQLDLISAFEAGVTNVVAPLGTAFTDDQARLIARQAKEILVCFDADRAGQTATSKAFAKLAPAGATVRVVPIPAGEDPDSMIRKGGADAFREAVARAEDYFDFLIRVRGASAPDATIARRAELAQELAAKAALVADPLVRGAVIQSISTRLGVGADQLAAAAQQSAAAAQRRTEVKSGRQQPVTGLPSANLPTLCRLLLNSGPARQWLREHGDPGLFDSVPGGKLAKLLWEGDLEPEAPSSISAFLADLPEATQDAVTRLLVGSSPAEEADDADKAVRLAQDCWLALRRLGLENRLQDRHSRLARLTEDAAELWELLREIESLESQLKGLPARRSILDE